MHINKEGRLNLRVGVTATRHGLSDIQKAVAKNILEGKCGEFHHGDCVGGDSELHDIVRQHYKDHWRVIVHPPINNALRAFKLGDEIREPLGYLARNKMIVLACDVLLGFPKSKEQIGGTWSTISFCEKVIAGGEQKQCHIILPNGDTGTIVYTPNNLRGKLSEHERKHGTN